MGTIWNVGAGDPGSLSVRNAISGKPLKVDSHSLGGSSVKLEVRRDGAPCVAADS